MNEKIFKWGILGPGKIAGKFATDLATVPGARVFAVASRNLERAIKFAREHNCERSYGSYEELTADEEVDVIYVATPHVFHFEHTLLCIDRRKPVLCEKPFAMDAGQVERMITVAKKNKTFLMEGMWTSFLPHFRFLLDLVEKEKYGRILNVKADFGFEAPYLPEKRLYNKGLGGGSLLDIGIYPVFLALSLLGIPQKINATAEIGETGVDLNCEMLFEYKNGATAKLFSTVNKTIPTIAEIQFEKAKVILQNRFHEPTSILIEQEGEQKTLDFKFKTRGYDFEAAHVQQMLMEGNTESTVMTFQKSKDLIHLLDSIREKIDLQY